MEGSKKCGEDNMGEDGIGRQSAWRSKGVEPARLGKCWDGSRPVSGYKGMGGSQLEELVAAKYLSMGEQETWRHQRLGCMGLGEGGLTKGWWIKGLGVIQPCE